MSLREGAYAKIKSIEYKENYATGKITISKKVKNSNPTKYYCSFSGYATFVGDAFHCRPQEGQKIKITSYEVSNGYLDKDGNQKFLDKVKVAIFGYELQEDVPQASALPKFDLDIDESSLPF